MKKTVPADTTTTELPVSALHPRPRAASILCTNFLPAISSFFFPTVLLSELKMIFRNLTDCTAGGDCFAQKQDTSGEQKEVSNSLACKYWLEKQKPQKTHWQNQSSLYPWSVC